MNDVPYKDDYHKINAILSQISSIGPISSIEWSTECYTLADRNQRNYAYTFKLLLSNDGCHNVQIQMSQIRNPMYHMACSEKLIPSFLNLF